MLPLHIKPAWCIAALQMNFLVNQNVPPPPSHWTAIPLPPVIGMRTPTPAVDFATTLRTIFATSPPPHHHPTTTTTTCQHHHQHPTTTSLTHHNPPPQELPEAALFLATPEAARANAPHLAALATWAPAGAVEGLQLMSGPALLHAGVKAYALRCLHATAPARVAFFLPQLVLVGVVGGEGAVGRGCRYQPKVNQNQRTGAAGRGCKYPTKIIHTKHTHRRRKGDGQTCNGHVSKWKGGWGMVGGATCGRVGGIPYREPHNLPILKKLKRPPTTSRQ